MPSRDEAVYYALGPSCARAWRRQLERGAAIGRSAGTGQTVERSAAADDDPAGGICAIASAGKAVEHGFRPCAVNAARQFEDRAQAVCAAILGRAVEDAVRPGVQPDRAHPPAVRNACSVVTPEGGAPTVALNAPSAIASTVEALSFAYVAVAFVGESGAAAVNG